jgi:hypothetical protein
MASAQAPSQTFPHQPLVDALRADADTVSRLRLRVATANGLAVYNYTAASPRNELTRLCRGLILDEQFNIVAACMPRFFNITETDIKLDPNAVYDVEDKMDGSYIQFYHYRGRIHISTRGTVSAESATLSDGSNFADNVVTSMGFPRDAEFQSVLNGVFESLGLHTLWFEYTSPNNRIVTLYSDDRVTLLGGFTTSGSELDDEGRSAVHTALSAHCRLHTVSRRCSSIAELDRLIHESNSSHEDEYDSSAPTSSPLLEGYIIHVDGVRYKYKNPKWVLAHLSTHNLTFERVLHNVLYRAGDVTELISMMPDLAATYVPVINTVRHLNRRIVELWGECRKLPSKYEVFQHASKSRDGVLLHRWYQNLELPPRDFAADICNNEVASMKRRITLIQQLDMLPKQISPARIPEEWSQFGCRDSTDVDIVIFVRRPELLYANYEASYFERLFPGRSIDITVALIRESNGAWFIKQTTRGVAAITHNIVLSTARSRTPLTSPLELDTRIMVSGISAHFLRFMNVLVPESTFLSERGNRNRALCAGNKIEYAASVLRTVKPIDSDAWRSEMKAIVMKMLQAELYHHDRSEEYDKCELAAAAAAKLGLPESGLLWYLYRGTRGDYHPDLLEELVDRHLLIAREVAVEPVWRDFPMTLDSNPTRLDAELFSMFMKSPVDCTPQFATRFHLIHGERPDSVQNVFSTENSPVEMVPGAMRHFAIDVVQGSREWRELQRRYNAQSVSGGEPADHPLGYAARHYNMIRGLMLESLAINSIADTVEEPNAGNEGGATHYSKVHVGMLLDRGTEQAISPDLLLVSRDHGRVIIYEFKCIFGAKNSAAYRRGVWMATRQLKRAANMILKRGILVRCRLVIVYVACNGIQYAEVAEIDV